MTNYIILTVEDHMFSGASQDLSNQVRLKLSEGWVPQGGVSVTITKHYNDVTYYIFSQAMVKE